MTGPRLSFRSLARQDFSLLSQWLSAPHVRKWWREDFDEAAVEQRYGPAVDGRDPTELFVIERDGNSIGFIQRYLLEDNPEWQNSLAVAGSPNDGAGIDYVIGPETLIGQGLGPEIIDLFVEDTWTRYPKITAVVVSVSQDNIRSWRALEKAGFHRLWSGALVSDDPSDADASHVYVIDRPPPVGEMDEIRSPETNASIISSAAGPD
jgi:aminoglycoside 6'-N-acetyltransferase